MAKKSLFTLRSIYICLKKALEIYFGAKKKKLPAPESDAGSGGGQDLDYCSAMKAAIWSLRA